jgi:hypothetical protein
MSLTSNARKWSVIAIPPVTCAAIQVAMNQFTSWSPEAKASVWVAIGTLALAAVTAWSVYQTRSIIGAEDRRHQQGFAPLLVFDGHHIVAGNLFYLIKNVGMGMAIGVMVRTEGTFYSSEFQRGIIPMTPYPERPYEGETSHALIVKDDIGDIIIHPMPPDYGGTRPGSIEITYYDMFDNRYLTRYPDVLHMPTSYDWIQPVSLRPSRADRS